MPDANSPWETSTVATALERALEGSRIVTALRASFRAESRPMIVARRLAAITRQSFLFRWLTAEPDPDVIVIDLRETWTVGPVIAVLDRLAPHAARAWNGSTLRTTAERTATAFRAAPVRLASALFLGALIVQFVTSWDSAGDATLAILCFLTAVALVGLRVDWTWDELAESRVGRLAAALFVRPEPPADEN